MEFDIPEDWAIEQYECFGCYNVFYVDDMGEMQEINRPSYCPYCGAEFGLLVEDSDEEG